MLIILVQCSLQLLIPRGCKYSYSASSGLGFLEDQYGGRGNYFGRKCLLSYNFPVSFYFLKLEQPKQDKNQTRPYIIETPPTIDVSEISPELRKYYIFPLITVFLFGFVKYLSISKLDLKTITAVFDKLLIPL